MHNAIPDFTRSSQKLWLCQHRNGADQPWLHTYAFSEMEFTPSDFQMMNYFTSTHRSSWFTCLIVCVKMILEDGEIVGDITFFGGEIKRRVKGKSEVLVVCKSEE
jgi:arylamine N-acetyltransferase